MKLRPKRPANENAARLLPRLARQFFKAGDQAAQNEVVARKVHGFRIRTKRFRYALEYFAPCYGQALGTYVEMLKELQATLGALNDCVSSRQMLAGLLEAGDPPRRHKKLFGALDQREQKLLEEFREVWEQKFAGRDVSPRWQRYLSHPARGRPRAANRSGR